MRNLGQHATILVGREKGNMTEEHKGLPVAGYQPQSDEKVKLVNSNKEAEERLLRLVEKLFQAADDNPVTDYGGRVYSSDKRWLAIARTHFEQGFMALNRSIFQPQRIALPEDVAQQKTELGTTA